MHRTALAVLLLAVFTLALSGRADAQTYYLDLRGAYSHVYDTDLSGPGLVGEAVFDQGYGAAAAVGLQWVDGWRFEGEVSWQRSDIESVAGVTTEGRAETYTAALNIYYRLMHERSATPYLGGGIGAARLGVSDLPAGLSRIDDYDVVLALQAMAGVDFSISQSVTLSVEYRYFAAAEADLFDDVGNAYEMEFTSSTAMLGIRLGF